MKTLKTTIAAAAVALAFAGTAQATTYDFSYFGSTDASINGSGEFFTGSPTSPYLLTGITGNVNGSGGITGLSSYAGADNLLYFPASPGYVDFSGISFSTSTGPSWNLYYDNGTFALRSDLNPGGNASSESPINLTVTAAIPEPETYAMMLAGLGLMGFVIRRRKQKVAVA